jgi:citrate lyase subunit beta / citryl-CoA lyase
VLVSRSNLLIRGLRPAAFEAAATTAADAVTLDLAAPETNTERAGLRQLAAKHAPQIAKRGRAVHLRIADTRSAELDADLEALVSAAITAVLLSGAEEPQDVRDADIAIRKREMRRKLEPGHVRLIPEVDSAAGLRALPRLIEAVDRHGAIALNIDALARDFGVDSAPAASLTLFEHAMAAVAIEAHAAGLPWLLLAPEAGHGTRSALANRAHALGAAGVYVGSESEAAGFRQLFTPRASEVATARAMLDEWERIRATEAWVGTIDGVLVDRRTVRRARRIVALDAAIHSTDRARSRR